MFNEGIEIPVNLDFTNLLTLSEFNSSIRYGINTLDSSTIRGRILLLQYTYSLSTTLQNVGFKLRILDNNKTEDSIFWAEIGTFPISKSETCFSKSSIDSTNLPNSTTSAPAGSSVILLPSSKYLFTLKL